MDDEEIYTLFGYNSDGQISNSFLDDTLFQDGLGNTESTADSDVVGDSYANIHRAIDETLSLISHQRPDALDSIRQHNRWVVERLAYLESNMSSAVRDVSSSTVLAGPSSDMNYDRWLPGSSPMQATGVAAKFQLNHRPKSLQSHTGYSTDDSSPAIPSSSAGPSQPQFPTAQTGASSPSTSSRSTSQATRPARVRRRRNRKASSSSPEDLRGHSLALSSASLELHGDARLAEKLFKIVEVETASRISELARRFQIQEPLNSDDTSPGSNGFPSMAQITDGDRFLQMLPRLASTIENNIFGEQNYRVRKRMALAQFYHAYTLAQENPVTFLSWCERHQVSQSILPKGGYKSMVQRRFAELMFPRNYASAAGGLREISSVRSAIQVQVGKIQTWRKSGKHWARIVMRFGYGILLLVPPNLTDEDLRVAHDDDMAQILDTLEENRHRFAMPLAQANALIRMHFQTSIRTPQTPSSTATMPAVMDWSGVAPPR